MKGFIVIRLTSKIASSYFPIAYSIYNRLEIMQYVLMDVSVLKTHIASYIANYIQKHIKKMSLFYRYYYLKPGSF